jgi:hypothetical protein
MNRTVVDRVSAEAALLRRRAKLTPAAATEWVVAKAVVIPAAVTGLVNRILHRTAQVAPVAPVAPIVPPSLRRHAGVYVWRPTFGPDGMPDPIGEIVPLDEFNKATERPIS